jgi:hypothetical protein
MLLATVPGLMLAPGGGKPESITIFVGFPVRDDGFVDADRSTSDSIKDIREAYVLGRGHGPATSAGTLYVPGTTTYNPGTTTTTQIGGTTWQNTTPATVTTAPGLSIEMQSKLTYVATTLRIGTFERPFVGEGQDAGWRACAKKIAQDVATWLTANRERIKSDTPPASAK